MFEFTGRLTPEHAAPRQDRDRSARLRRDARHTRCAAGRDRRPRRAAAVGGADAGRRARPALRARARLCPQKDLPLHGATVVVRIDHDDLVNGTGFATIDGITAPVSVATARRMAAGGQSHLLRPRRRHPDPGLGPHEATVHPHPAARAGRTRRRLRDVRSTPRAYEGPPHPMVGPRRRTHRPEQRRPASASPVTTASTTTVGTSASTASGSRQECGSSPHPTSTPTRTPRLGGRARYDYAA